MSQLWWDEEDREHPVKILDNPKDSLSLVDGDRNFFHYKTLRIKPSCVSWS